MEGVRANVHATHLRQHFAKAARLRIGSGARTTSISARAVTSFASVRATRIAAKIATTAIFRVEVKACAVRDAAFLSGRATPGTAISEATLECIAAHAGAEGARCPAPRRAGKSTTSAVLRIPAQVMAGRRAIGTEAACETRSARQITARSEIHDGTFTRSIGGIGA